MALSMTKVFNPQPGWYRGDFFSGWIGELIGQSQAMRQIYTVIGAVSTNKSTVLITGESGTGKELVAQALHFNSPRKDKLWGQYCYPDRADRMHSSVSQLGLEESIRLAKRGNVCVQTALGDYYMGWTRWRSGGPLARW